MIATNLFMKDGGRERWWFLITASQTCSWTSNATRWEMAHRCVAGCNNAAPV